MSAGQASELKERIDSKLDAAGWKVGAGAKAASRTAGAQSGGDSAEYVLRLDGQVAAVVEAGKPSGAPQSALAQAQRYAKGLSGDRATHGERPCPFLYATDGEAHWFHDVRHPLNRPRRVSGFHTPAALRELLGRDFDEAAQRLLGLPNHHPLLRPYQRDANVALDKAIAARRREMLVAMATGTGKTITAIHQIHRLLKSGVARRVLYLVDRRALAAQAARAFAAFEVEKGLHFDEAYEVVSNRFRPGDFAPDEREPTVATSRSLSNPKPNQVFVYICTIQRMAIHVLGAQAIFAGGEEIADEDLKRLKIPIHAFDVVVSDECHRGYTSSEVSVWRDTLDHFDAIKIGLTATPAAHTTSYFKNLVSRYDYPQAVRDDVLVDYDIVTVRTGVSIKDQFLKESERAALIDPITRLRKRDQLHDERSLELAEIETKIAAPEPALRVVAELRKQALEHERTYGRFPKTLIFTTNDVQPNSHADQIVKLCRDAFGRGDAFVERITGRAYRPLQRIREFRNRPNPGIAVTVDLLINGVDLPDLEFLVFLRPVKSRILFEQMLGRGARRGEKYPDKSHFTIFDCFGGDLLRYFKESTGITAEPPDASSRPIAGLVEDIWANHERAYSLSCVVKRLLRVEKQMAGEGRKEFAAFLPDGDVRRYADGLPLALKADFVGAMKLLRNSRFQELMVNYPRPPRTVVVVPDLKEQARTTWQVRERKGEESKPDDYLAGFEKFVRENPEQIQAIGILLDRPKEWGPGPLTELKAKLKATPQRFTVENLQKAHKATYQRNRVDLISMVKHAADEKEPLLTAAERVERAFARVVAGHDFTPDQQVWLDQIRAHLRENLSIDEYDFDNVPLFLQQGGRAEVQKLFKRRLPELLHDLNEALAV